MSVKQVILVGGMPTAGKSTLAENLSSHLNLPWFSTDQIGIIMQSVATRETHPELLRWDDYSNDPSIGDLTAEEIADNEFAKAGAVWPGLRKLIQHDYTWNDGAVFEGVDILPHLVAQDFRDSDVVRPVFVGDHDPGRVRATVLDRDAYSLWDEAKEVEWVLKFSEKLRSEVDRYGFPWVDLEKNDRDLVKVLGALGLS